MSLDNLVLGINKSKLPFEPWNSRLKTFGVTLIGHRPSLVSFDNLDLGVIKNKLPFLVTLIGESPRDINWRVRH